MQILLLVIAFAVTALLYASVGFGGGSTYTSLLALAEIDYRLIAPVSLICNVLVVAGGTWRFHRAGAIEWGRIWPLFAASLPLALVGGSLEVPREVFLGLLGLSLLVASALMLLRRGAGEPVAIVPPPTAKGMAATAATGGALGFLSGIVGIGGGVFLAPILYLTRWQSARAIAGTASAFILFNSLAGLAGQLSKDGRAEGVVQFWPLFVAVVLGGQIGSWLGAVRLPRRALEVGTALLILFVALRLLWQLFRSQFA
ncbi:UPF0721 transmembrane protein [Alteripontixanthobacter maritimus]|uniref:Probable membrane transporter protein n=1 Tax=Alteripontixanthobacter maritimus TaxID=2161824 RepID=A0A369QC81_9SPHN|nr:sulfite exporter TauE/SafE family protein [Alteripontixanthobacter maritimus]RDC60846.1 UPF0721 transmembrane protein [Alteripontixanthobacter maritimus]